MASIQAKSILDDIEGLLGDIRSVLRPHKPCMVFNCNAEAVLPTFKPKYCPDHFGQMVSDGKGKRKTLQVVKAKGSRPNGKKR